MSNVVMLIRIPGATNVRPFGTAGMGVIRAVFETWYDLADTGQNNPGFNVGGGILYSLNDRVGLRGDVRYMRALVDENKHEGGFFKDLRLLASDSRCHTRVRPLVNGPVPIRALAARGESRLPAATSMLVLFVTVLMGRQLADEKFRLSSESRHPPECYDRPRCSATISIRGG